MSEEKSIFQLKPKRKKKCKHCGKLLDNLSPVHGYITKDGTFCYDQFCSAKCSIEGEKEAEESDE